jgi:hypothetical protein
LTQLPLADRWGELGEQLADPPADVIADATHAVRIGVGRVVPLPVLIALAWEDRAGLAATHRHDSVRATNRGDPHKASGSTPGSSAMNRTPAYE